MPFLTVGTNNDDLTLQVPAKRTTDWANEFLDNFVRKIVNHDHSGNGRGKQLTSMALAANSVTQNQILLSDGSALQWQNPNTGNATDIISYSDADNKITITGTIQPTGICTSNTINLATVGLTDTGIESVTARIIHYSATVDGTSITQIGTIFIDENNIITHEYSTGTSNSITVNGYLGVNNTLHITSNLSSSAIQTFKYITIDL